MTPSPVADADVFLFAKVGGLLLGRAMSHLDAEKLLLATDPARRGTIVAETILLVAIQDGTVPHPVGSLLLHRAASASVDDILAYHVSARRDACDAVAEAFATTLLELGLWGCSHEIAMHLGWTIAVVRDEIPIDYGWSERASSDAGRADADLRWTGLPYEEVELYRVLDEPLPLFWLEEPFASWVAERAPEMPESGARPASAS